MARGLRPCHDPVNSSSKEEIRLIRIRFSPHPAEHVAFAYSPLLECVLSLHVLVGPKHHALQHGWVRQMRALDPALRRRIDDFSFLYRWTLPSFLLPDPGGDAESFESELERILGLSAELQLEALGRPLYDHGGAGPAVFDEPEVRETMLARGGELGKLLLDDPPALALLLCELLSDYWDAAFAAEWSRIEPKLADAVVESGRALASAGIWAVLGRLPPRCRPDPERNELVVDLPHDHELEISEANPLVLSPSVFAWPHLRLNCDPPWPTAIVYAAPFVAREAAPRIPPDELLRVLRALGDDTRLRILKLVAERPRTTQELGPLVGLSAAGLSKSLRRLADAGLVTSHREGYYIVYTLEPTRLADLSTTVGRFLEG
jgi:DNA-binding transcriptional ArsR family regulator